MASNNSAVHGNRVVHLIHRLGARNAVVFSVVVASALILTGARTLAPFEVGKDQSGQLEAAQNLVMGKGLTTTNDVPPASHDIMVNSQPKYLTWWPPGFSLIVAAFLAMGFSLLVSLKIVYALVTLVGWIGWGIIISHFIVQPLRLGGREYPVHLVIAGLLPVFFTLGWDGTDIFLWAGIPFLFLWVFNQEREQASYLSVAAAGLLFGALYAIRYASLFLGLATLLILIQVRFPSLRASLKRFAVFLLTGLVIILPTYLYSKFYAVGTTGIAQRATLTRLTSSLANAIKGIFQKLPFSSNMILGSPLPDLVVFRINSHLILYAYGTICLATLLLMPIVLIENRKRSGQRSQNDMALGLWFLPLSLLAFLITVDIAVRLGLLGVRRYYEPLAFCGVLVFYQLANTLQTRRIVGYASRAIVLFFIAYICVYMPALAFMSERNGQLVYTVLGFTPANNVKYRGTSYNISYPSFTIYSSMEGTRQKIRQLAEADPQALFFVEEYGYFIYDGFQQGGPIPGKTLRVFPRIEYWREAYTSAPVKVYWVLNERTTLSFVAPANQEVAYFDRFEQTKILESEFPAGHRFATME
jgi:hypothetical protein